ncbi:MAG: LPXTG cell wall anchor domain-containing protein [Candidatus Gracilibacteria bacterium]|nr:LPXTG cell wall anchor domain-containing protein [Candidatus Gracilibacteria bacterium]
MKKIGVVLLLCLLSTFTINNIYASTVEDDLSALFSEIMNSTSISEETELNSAWEEDIINELNGGEDNSTVISAEQNIENDVEVELNSAGEESITTTNNVEIKVLPKTGPTEILLLLISLLIAGVLFYNKRRKTI